MIVDARAAPSGPVRAEGGLDPKRVYRVAMNSFMSTASSLFEKRPGNAWTTAVVRDMLELMFNTRARSRQTRNRSSCRARERSKGRIESAYTARTRFNALALIALRRGRVARAHGLLRSWHAPAIECFETCRANRRDIRVGLHAASHASNTFPAIVALSEWAPPGVACSG